MTFLTQRRKRVLLCGLCRGTRIFDPRLPMTCPACAGSGHAHKCRCPDCESVTVPQSRTHPKPESEDV